MFEKLREWVIGKPRSATDQATRKHIALIAFMAWIALGADGLSSSCYGPEQAYYALGIHTHLALYLAIATSLTVFLISLAYNQVIKLFPNGGGGYKVATNLLGPYAGLVSGAALIIDYILTIAVSVASGVDALFSLLPYKFQHYKLFTEICLLILLVILNLRGAKESTKVLMPLFLGFVITHIFVITAGISLHGSELSTLIPAVIDNTRSAISYLGVLPVVALFLRAYSLGAGTYTGIEAVSNNIHILAEPRVRTGRWTMFYMASSLSLVAGGIILLYLLWSVHAVPGETLNAVVFQKILAYYPFQHFNLFLILALEAGLLFVAANTGFLGGPAVLANMSIDSWVPRRFSLLSSRLVTQNGILLFGIAAIIILLWTKGDVSYLVVLYSINVFLTFSMSLLGLTIYFIRNRSKEPGWVMQVIFSLIALIVCASILAITLIEKFDLGGWLTVVITSTVIVLCLLIKNHYRKMNHLKKQLDYTLNIPVPQREITIPAVDPKLPTAVFLIKDLGAAMHSILWVHRMFPNYFKNFIFISHGVVDIGSFGSDRKLAKLRKDTYRALDYLVRFSHQYGYAATSYSAFGTDPVNDIVQISEKINHEFINAVYFASRYIYPTDSWINRVLHSDLAPIIQKRLHLLGTKMLILPLNLQV